MRRNMMHKQVSLASLPALPPSSHMLQPGIGPFSLLLAAISGFPGLWVWYQSQPAPAPAPLSCPEASAPIEPEVVTVYREPSHWLLVGVAIAAALVGIGIYRCILSLATFTRGAGAGLAVGAAGSLLLKDQGEADDSDLSGLLDPYDDGGARPRALTAADW